MATTSATLTLHAILVISRASKSIKVSVVLAML